MSLLWACCRSAGTGKSSSPFERERYSKVFLNDVLSPLYAILTAPTAFIHNSELIFVEPDTLDATAKLSKIRKVLRSNGLVAGVSSCFHDVSFVRWAYHQCKMGAGPGPSPCRGGRTLLFSRAILPMPVQHPQPQHRP